MVDLLLFGLIVMFITHAIASFYFTTKFCITIRTMFVKLRNHATAKKSYLLYLIADCALSRSMVTYALAICVAAIAYKVAMMQQPGNVAVLIIIGEGLFAAGLLDVLREALPMLIYPEDDYYGAYFPWHEDLEDDEDAESSESFQAEKSIESDENNSKVLDAEDTVAGEETDGVSDTDADGEQEEGNGGND